MIMTRNLKLYMYTHTLNGQKKVSKSIFNEDPSGWKLIGTYKNYNIINLETIPKVT